MALLTQLLRPADLALLDERQVRLLVGTINAEVAANLQIQKLLQTRINQSFKELVQASGESVPSSAAKGAKSKAD